MMKRYFLMMMVAALTSCAWAIPAKPGQWRILQLENGTTVRAELVGDEHLHYWQDEQGNAYTETESRLFRLANKEELRVKAEERMEKANARRSVRRRTIIGSDHNPYIGEKRGIVILVQFNDVKFQTGHDNALFTRMMNEEGFNYNDRFKGSVRDYFLAQSDNQFHLDFDVYGPYDLPASLSYYGGDVYDESGTRLGDKHAGTMVAKACEIALQNGVDFSPYDWDGDGYVDQVYILFAGLGQANGGAAETIWPHEHQLRHSDYSKTFKAGSVTIDTYACGPELQPNGRQDVRIDGIGTLCHEFSHCLGLPDMYDTNYSGQYGMANWDLMDQGSYNNHGYTPAGYTSYERMYAGWRQPIELDSNTTVSGMKGLQDGGETYIIRNDGHPNEYFLLENRTKTGWDAAVDGEGLLVIHVDFDENVWRSNSVNTIDNINDHPRCTPVQADNGVATTNTSTDVFPYRDHNSFSNTSTPMAQWYNYNSKGNHKFNKIIKNITKAEDKTISFTFIDSAQDDAIEQTDIDYTNALFAETFNKMKGTGGNDGVWEGDAGYSIFRGADNTGWTYSMGNAANACAKFGTEDIQGYATTPTFTLSNDAVIYFSVAPWGDDETSIVLSASSTDATNFTLGQTTFSLENGKWNVCKTTLSGNGSLKLTFTANGGSQFFLDGVAVRDALTDDITAPLHTESHPFAIYDLQGRFVGRDFDALPCGIYIVNGKKVMK